MSGRDPGRVVIVGGGLAGYSAAESLRARGFDGPVTVIEGEPALYDRPPLSKEAFVGGAPLERLAFATPEKLAELRIETITGHRATSIDPDAASVALDDGRVLPAGTILLTTGGRARLLDVPGADLPHVRVLRTYADARSLRDSVQPGTRVVAVGAGLIGAELASSLHALGARVTLVDPVEVPLVPAVGEVMARYLHAMHSARGLEVRLGGLAAVEKEGEEVVAVLPDGTRIPADLVVIGVGIIPNTELAEAAGIEVDGGIIVDDAHRTSSPRVFAAGDVARFRRDGLLERREEHWEAAQIAGREAAAGILGDASEPRGAPWFWSDRHGIHLEAVGRLTGDGRLIIRDSDPHPAVFLVDDGLLVGAASVDDANTVRAARRLIDQRIPVDESALADPTVTLRSMLKAGQAVPTPGTAH